MRGGDPGRPALPRPGRAPEGGGAGRMRVWKAGALLGVVDSRCWAE